MPRNITLSFGLVSVAAKVDKAVATETPMVNLCVGQPGHAQHDASPLTAPRTCVECGVVTDYEVLKKGIKDGSSYAVVDAADVTDAAAAYSDQYKGVVAITPHPASDFLTQTAPGKSVNYISPADDKAAGHYQLLRQLVESHPELAFAALHTPRSKTSLFLVRVHDGVLVLEERVRTEAMLPVPSVGGEVNDALYQMLDSLIDAAVVPYDPTAYEDQYRKALDTLAANASDVIGVKRDDTKAATPVATSDDDLLAKLAALKGA